MLATSMHADVERLLSLKKVTKLVAEKLNQFSPGSYCLHRTWGTGKVISWELRNKELLIDFEGKSEPHAMALAFAMRALSSIAPDHFRAVRFDELDRLRKLYKTNALDLLEEVVTGHGGEIKPEEVESSLKGSVIPENEYKNWWERTKVAARAETKFIIPTRKGELIRMREQGLSKVAAIYSDYCANRDLKSRVRVLEAASADVLKNEPEQTLQLLTEVEADIQRGGKLALQQVLELAVLRDDLISKLGDFCAVPAVEPLANLITNFEEGQLVCNIIAAIPGTRQKKVYEAFPVAFGDKWIKEALRIFDFAGTRATGEVAKFLLSQGKEAEKAFYDHLLLGISRHSLHTDALIWMCRERENGAKPVFGYDIASAILAHLDKDHSETGNSGVLRLKNYLMDTKSLIKDLLVESSTNDIRRFAKALMNCPALPDLDRKSLFARIIAVEPSVHELILGSEKKEEDLSLIASWESLQRKKEELEDILNRRIPENVRDIAIARDHGDLRENGDYKAAKEEQTKLARQRAELERDIHLGRGTDFSNADTASVNVGTIVTVKTATGNPLKYTILGAWDSDPEQGIFSYKSAIGQRFLGLKVGEILEFNLDDSTKPEAYTVMEIVAYNPA